MELLRSMGVDYAQGYGIARPQFFFMFTEQSHKRRIVVPVKT